MKLIEKLSRRHLINSFVIKGFTVEKQIKSILLQLLTSNASVKNISNLKL